MDSNISTLKLQEKFQKQWELCTNRPVAKIFRGGGGGYFKDQDQIITIEMFGHAKGSRRSYSP